MAYAIDARRVAGVVTEANQSLTGKGFNHGEVIIGLSELMGRIIVDASSTKVQADELIKVSMNHLEQTIRIGADSKGKRIITGV